MREDKKKELNTEKKLLEKTMNEFTTENKLQKEIHDQDIRLQTGTKVTTETMNVKLLLLDKDPNKDKEFAFRIHRKNPLKKLKDLFSKRISFPVAKLHFFLSESDTVSGPDGRKIEDEDTPDSLDMQDGDYIDVCNDSWIERKEKDDQKCNDRIDSVTEAAQKPVEMENQVSLSNPVHVGKKRNGKISPSLTELTTHTRSFSLRSSPECECLQTLFQLRNLSKVGGDDKKLYSAPVYVRNIPWRLLVYKTKEHLSCYLVCYMKAKHRAWSCVADAKIYLRSKIKSEDGKNKDLMRKYSHQRFNNKDNDWGWTDFVKLSVVNDPSKGYTTDDSLLFDVTILAEAPIGIRMKKKQDVDSPIQVKSIHNGGKDTRDINELLEFIETKSSKKKSKKKSIKPLSKVSVVETRDENDGHCGPTISDTSSHDSDLNGNTLLQVGSQDSKEEKSIETQTSALVSTSFYQTVSLSEVPVRESFESFGTARKTFFEQIKSQSKCFNEMRRIKTKELNIMNTTLREIEKQKLETSVRLQEADLLAAQLENRLDELCVTKRQLVAASSAQVANRNGIQCFELQKLLDENTKELSSSLRDLKGYRKRFAEDIKTKGTKKYKLELKKGRLLDFLKTELSKFRKEERKLLDCMKIMIEK